MALSLFSLQRKVALVTGGAGWLGLPMVEALAEAGARVVIASRDAGMGAAAVKRLRAGGHRVDFIAYDQSEADSIERAVGATIEMAGGIDILVNNAAQWPMRSRTGPLVDFAASMQMNATGLFSLTRKVGTHMAERGGGSIVNIGSAFGMVGPDFSIYEGLAPEGGLPDYFFHKGGMLQLTRYMAAWFGPRGVRSNTISFGPFRKQQSDELARRFEQRTLLRRMGNRDDVKGAVVFLASDASAYVTGSNLVVDGGYTAI